MPILTIYQGAQIKTVEAKAGTLLSDALRDAGAAVALPCGGRGVPYVRSHPPRYAPAML